MSPKPHIRRVWVERYQAFMWQMELKNPRDPNIEWMAPTLDDLRAVAFVKFHRQRPWPWFL